jgi:uncharacterized protein involved in outer membrane biogenesis
VALVLLFVFFPWNVLRGPIAAYASDRLARAVAIDHLSVDLGSTTRVQFDGLSIANVPWAKVEPMATSKQAILWFTLRSLLRLEPVKAQLIDANVTLERNEDGNDNWHMGTTELATRIGNIEVERGVVRFRDAKAGVDMTLQLQTIAPESDERTTLRFTGQGTYHGEAVLVEGKSFGLAQLQDIDDPYHLALNASSGRTHVNFVGSITPSDAENLHGVLRLQGPDLSKLYPIVPAPLPWTPPYSLTGELAHSKGVWNFRRIKGTVGDSDLKGDVRLDVAQRRTLMTADLTSARFDSKDLGALVGGPPAQMTQRGQTAQQQPAKRRFSSRVLPDRPLELAMLREHDADVTFRGTSVKWSAIPMDNLLAKLKLKDGVLSFQPLDFGIADGHVIANFSLDATHNIAKVEGEIEAHNVELKRLVPKLASPRGTAGRFGGRAHFKTQGNTVATLLAAVNGDAAVIMRGGEASTLQLVLTNLDLARAAELLLRGDETAEIRCVVGAFHARDGVMTPDLFKVDTSAVVINGAGAVNFRDERYDLLLEAKSKRPSLLALRGPIVIGGTFNAPIVGPAVGPVVARVGAAVGLGLLAPPLALLPLIDFGGASDLDCRALIEQARVNTAMTQGVTRAGTARRPPTPPKLAKESARQPHSSPTPANLTQQ